MIINTTTKVVTVVLSLVVLSACGLFSDLFVDKNDRIREGSLTLTPLRIPQDLTSPDTRDALQIQSTDKISAEDSLSNEKDLEKPPQLDLDAATELEKSLRSDSGKSSLKTGMHIPSSLAVETDGHSVLIVEASFDEIWEYLDEVLKNLGFEVTDRNRSLQIYEISRQMSKTQIEEKELRDTGVARTTGTREEYQVHVEQASKPADAVAIPIRQCKVLIRNSQGQPDSSSLARHLLVQIKAFLEQPINL